MIVTCHLSTGGSPQYLLEYLKTILNDYTDIKIIEFTNFSNDFTIQKNKIKDLIGEGNVICLGEYGVDTDTWYSDKMKLIDIIDDYTPDTIWMNEFPENYEYKMPPDDLMNYIYREDRPYKIIETTHFNAFNFDYKRFIGDEFMFCSPHHIEKSKKIDIKKYLWEVPMEIQLSVDRDTTLESLGLDPSYIHILNVGLFNKNKNQKYIYELANEMKTDKVMFHFVGNECFFSDCGLTNEELSLNNCKRWGERSDVDVFMSCMDMYLFPSHKELSPITIREALSHQMVVVANRDEYVVQYEDYDNFHILDEVNPENMIKSKLKKFLLVCSFYNKEYDQIKRTIDSVINQSYTNWELIIGDDLSDNDYCKESVLDYLEFLDDDRITFYPIKYKYELYLYQNFFKEREYDYYFDLDSDDIIDVDLLDIYQKHFIRYPEVNSLFCDYKVTDQDGKLQRHGLVKPSINLINDFNVRTYQHSYLGIWGKCHSWSMFGVGRCFRRSQFDHFEIDKRCKTATDSMVLFNAMLEGDHLHIPINLYTYERRVNSDSSAFLSQEESENYNINTLKALDKYDKSSNKVDDVYDDIYLETSAIILSGFKKDISLLTNINKEQLEKLKFLYNGEVKVNDLSCENIIIMTNKIDNIPSFDDKNVCLYKFFDDFNIEEKELEAYFNNEGTKLTQGVDVDRYFQYFRHLITHKDKKIINNMTENVVNITEFDGIKIEILGDIEENYLIEFIDGDTNNVIFSDNITNNMWTKPNIKYFVNWHIQVNGNNVYKQDLKGKRVMIEFGSSSLGDTIAWFPYLLEFKRKHDCEITVLTFKNWLFEDLEIYSEFEFMNHGESFININKKYEIGWFLKEDGEINTDYCPSDFRTIPLQQTASDILGLSPHQLRPNVYMKYTNDSPIDGKYVCIAIHSTAQAKYWNNPIGWQQTVEYLTNSGYKVVLISREEDGYMGNTHPKGIIHIDGDLEDISNYLKHSDFFIGISSGISWLAWAIGTPMVLISGFSEPYTEFLGEDIERVINKDVCNGCFNTHKLDAGDWNWCPLHKGTNKQFECTKKIYYPQVESSIKKIIEYVSI
jgi:autotransporter strand-loop-strand O-heptosyltransferase